jgi:lambda repressor-like predicted transcriptional regulator
MEASSPHGYGQRGGERIRRQYRRGLVAKTMSVTVHPGRLRQEITRRGWSPLDLAHAARLSPATVSAALNGKPIAASSLSLIAKALAAKPTLDVIDRLLFTDPNGPVLD